MCLKEKSGIRVSLKEKVGIFFSRVSLMKKVGIFVFPRESEENCGEFLFSRVNLKEKWDFPA